MTEQSRIVGVISRKLGLWLDKNLFDTEIKIQLDTETFVYQLRSS